MKASELKLMEGMISTDVTITMGTDWAKTSWAYVYLFSDNANN